MRHLRPARVPENHHRKGLALLDRSRNHHPSGEAQPMSEEKAVQLVEVKLTGEHIHKGVDYKAGDKIKVTPRQKAFLEEAKKVEGAATPSKEA